MGYSQTTKGDIMAHPLAPRISQSNLKSCFHSLTRDTRSSYS